VWSILSEVNHQLESRMREIRLSGSEGGGTLVLPTPIIVKEGSAMVRQSLTAVGCGKAAVDRAIRARPFR